MICDALVTGGVLRIHDQFSCAQYHGSMIACWLVVSASYCSSTLAGRARSSPSRKIGCSTVLDKTDSSMHGGGALFSQSFVLFLIEDFEVYAPLSFVVCTAAVVTSREIWGACSRWCVEDGFVHDGLFFCTIVGVFFFFFLVYVYVKRYFRCNC